MVRYVGFYSNVSRGKRRQENQDELISCIPEPDGFSKEWRKNWARLIQKIYEFKFGFTYKGESPIVGPQKRGFL